MHWDRPIIQSMYYFDLTQHVYVAGRSCGFYNHR